jgi:CubicO group peptidase (beta-lactamase class C family)
MHKKSKQFFRASVLILLLILASITLWRWLSAAPRKPASITAGDYTYTIEYAEYRIQQAMKQKHLPSLAVVLIDDQDTIWQESFGVANLETNQSAEPDTVYRLWSVAKAFTAIETLRLVEDGLIDLDTPITAYIPDFALQSRFPDSGPITIRSILTHRSGLPRNGCQWVELNPHVLADLVASLEDCYQTLPVGYRYKYSNVGFDLLGYFIEEMRGEPFPDYLREDLLLPIGMTNSAFLRAHLPSQSEVAPGYEFYEGEYYPYEQGDITSVPSGNLYATLEDMGKFVKFILREGKVNGAQLIDPATLKAMFVEQASSKRDPQPMGLGWKTTRVLGSELLIWHDGGPSDGTGALMAFLPERKLGVVLIANSTTFDGGFSVPLAVEILGLMLEVKYGLASPPEETPTTVEVERATLEHYVGKYIAFGEVLDVYLKGDQLKGSVYGFSFNLDPLSETRLQPRNWLADIGLTRILGAPVDLRQLKIEFMAGDEISSDAMIIHLSGFSYEFCPKYPDIGEIPRLWETLAGEYDLVPRLPSGLPGTEILGQTRIWVADGVLRMAGFVGPLLPISENEIIILSGAFAGETMVYDSETGNIYHQNIVYKRIIQTNK